VARGRVDAERGEPKILVDELILDLDQIRALEPAGRPSHSRPARTTWAVPNGESAEPVENGLEGEAEMDGSGLGEEGAPYGASGVSEAEDAADGSNGRSEAKDAADDSNGRAEGDFESTANGPVARGLEVGGGSAELGAAALETALLESLAPKSTLLEVPALEPEPLVWQYAESRQVTITLHSTGDRGRDTQRLRRIHGMLNASPGGDHYSILVYEASRCYHLEFPNSTTRYSPELHRQLMVLLGERAVQVEPLGLQ
jgi:hypothetical protein